MADRIALSPQVADRTVATTCYMCACRCGIEVQLRNGRIRYIQGNRAHPVNKGVLCAKGSAGIMHQELAARLTGPLRRVGPRGSGKLEPISWDEAMTLATSWLSEVRHRDPRRLAFFTGRDQSQALTGFWAKEFGTPNFAAHGGFCSVNMAAAGMYTLGGAFWEFGEPDWEHARYLLLLGVAEDHDSNPIKAGIAQLKARGAKVVSVNPVRTGYSAVADEWLPITPGTDGLLVMALCHELLRAGRVDIASLERWSDAGWLVIDAPGTSEDGLIARDAEGRPLAFDRIAGRLVPAEAADVRPALKGRFALPDGRSAVPVLELLARRCLDPAHAPDTVAGRTGIPAATIRRIAAELAAAALDDPPELAVPWTDVWGRRHATMPARPVAVHAMRGISAHSNGFQTARAIHVLQLLLGTIDAPGGFRFKSPYPKTVPPGPRPCGRPDQVAPGQPLPGMPLGYPLGPEDLIVTPDGAPARIDKAFSWEAPLAVHGMMHTVIGNAWRGDPYPIDVLLMYMANMAWNSAMSTETTIAMLTDLDPSTGEYRIPRIIYSDAFYSETVAYADLVLPDTTYLERHDCISLLDRPIGSADAIADAIRQPVVPPRHDVRPFQDVLIELGWRLGLPAFTREDGTPRYPGLYPDYMVRHERAPGIGPLAGWRGPDGSAVGKGAPNPDQLERYKANGCFFEHAFTPAQRHFKHVNRDYQELAVATGMMAAVGPVTSRLYLEVLQRFRLAARGHGPQRPPEPHRARIEHACDPLPFWYPPFEEGVESDPGSDLEPSFTLHAITQRPMAMYHSWGSMNPWLRQIHGENRLYVARTTAARLGIPDDAWVWIESRHGRVKAQVRLMDGVNPDTVWTWNAIGKRAGAWALDPRSPEVTRGFLLNHLIDELLPERESGYRYANADPITGQAAWYDLKVRLRLAEPAEHGVTAPRLPPIGRPASLARPPAAVRWSAAR